MIGGQKFGLSRTPSTIAIGDKKTSISLFMIGSRMRKRSECPILGMLVHPERFTQLPLKLWRRYRLLGRHFRFYGKTNQEGRTELDIAVSILQISTVRQVAS